MRTIGSSSSVGNVSGFAFIALIIGSAACSAGTTTQYVNADGTPVDATDPGAGTTTTTNDGTTPDPTTQGDPTNKDAPAPPLVAGLAITDVAVFQAVKVPVVAGGKVVVPSKRNSPVVANRPALIRAYVSPSSGYTATSVTAELRLVDGTTRLPVIKDTKTLSGKSTDEDIKSTFNFEVPADSLPPGVTYQVLLTAKGGTVPSGANDARFPKDGGVQSLDTMKSGTLKVLIVPVKYDADGSGRTPDVSATQLARYKQTFMARYPASEVVVTARAPYSYSQTISANGSGFSQVLNAITNLRKTDGAAADVYYYGALAPTSSFNSFCGGGCVTGLSAVVDSPKTSFLRASVGVGYSGNDSVNTAAHEVGHAHGRNHAPCGGAQGVDADFPYSGGQIGTWGYDIFAKTFLSPTKGRDMMGYCPNEWVSDYTYTALFDRIASLNSNPLSGATGSTSPAASQAAPAAAPQVFRMANVAADGSVSWTNDIELDEEPTDGKKMLATFAGPDGHALGTHTAHFYPYDHLPGGILVVPSAPEVSTVKGVASPIARAKLASTWTTVQVAGLANTLAR
ncbi:MAG: hypothetical protein JWP87_1901 [Labilithrix sp.]|nr:hypothetical protein [Labilithrix sp.]